MSRFFPEQELFVNLTRPDWHARGDWPMSWVDHPDRSLTEPSVALFRLPFTVEQETTIRIHVSADNRYRLYLDGQPVGRGPERGDPDHWRFESYELTLAPGEHKFVALTWWLADQAPFAQMSIRPGFLLAAEGEWMNTLSTGLAPWEATIIDGYEFLPCGLAWGTGAKVRIDGEKFPWGWENGEIGDWQPVKTIFFGMSAKYKNEILSYWLLTPSTLPAMREEHRLIGKTRYLVSEQSAYPVDPTNNLSAETATWDTWLSGNGTVTIPPHSTRRAVIDLENYYCAYPVLRVSGGKGSRIRILWAEGLYTVKPNMLLTDASGDLAIDWPSIPAGERPSKDNRNEVDGKIFIGVGDEFIADGGEHREFSTLWWQAGRYVEFMVQTGDEPLTLESLSFIETGYPMQMEGSFRCSDERLERIIPIALRVMQMCSHESYMDCPYYEQLMYVGDTRLEVLTTYALMHDDRLPRKAVLSFDESRRLSGLTQSRYPSKAIQIIPPFSLWWTCMVRDYWLWRDDADFVQQRLPGVRAVMESFRELIDENGLMGVPNGWNFTDWVPTWTWGVPPQGEKQPSSILNLHFALSLVYKAEVEEFFGETELAVRDRKTARSICDAVLKHFWSEERGLIADTLQKDLFSEHAQCLAILSGLLPADVQEKVVAGLLNDANLSRTTIYFTHYLFETYYRLGCPDRLLDRLSMWFDLEKLGFKTTFEEPEPSRSDCHAWGAHPVYHYYASILGIRPDGQGFHRVRIAPQLGALTSAEGVLPHPQGEIAIALRVENGQLNAQITLPQGVTGTFVWNGQEHTLKDGNNVLLLPALDMEIAVK